MTYTAVGTSADLAQIKSLIAQTKLYQTIVFPDFKLEGPRLAPELRSRFFDQLDLAGKSVVDLGCANGFFSFLAANKGARVTAYDKDAAAIKLARTIAAYYGKDIQFKEASFDLDFLESLPEFDVGIFLSVLQHIFNHAPADPIGVCRQTIHTLSRKCRTLIFEVGQSGEPFAWSAKMGMMGTDPKQWILDNLFAGSAYSDIQVFDPPLFDNTLRGRLARRVVDLTRRACLRPERPIGQAVARLAFQAVVPDPRDTRYLFIARR